MLTTFSYRGHQPTVFRFPEIKTVTQVRNVIRAANRLKFTAHHECSLDVLFVNFGEIGRLRVLFPKNGLAEFDIIEGNETAIKEKFSSMFMLNPV